MAVSTQLILNRLESYATIAALEAVDQSNAVDGGRVYVEENKFIYQFYSYLEDAADGSTVLAATGKGKWKQISDEVLMLNDSNALENAIDNVDITSIDLAAGTAAAPSLSFSATTDGLYSISAGSLGISTAGVLRATVAAGGITSTVKVILPDGTSAAPSLTFTTGSTTGLYQSAAAFIDFAISGAPAAFLTRSGGTSIMSLATTGSYRINNVQVLGPGISGYVIPAGSAGALRDASSINVDSASADDATVRLIARVLKALITDGLAHGYFTAP